jgi:hypothetical protein
MISPVARVEPHRSVRAQRGAVGEAEQRDHGAHAEHGASGGQHDVRAGGPGSGYGVMHGR